MKKMLAFLLASIILLSSFGCTTAARTSNTTVTPTPFTHVPQTLANTTWVLSSYGDTANMTPLLPNWKDITLTFNSVADRYSGSDGLNLYGGNCSVQNDNSIIMFAATRTLLGVSDPGITKQLQNYYDLLEKASNYNISNTDLMINCSNGQTLKFFLAIPTNK